MTPKKPRARAASIQAIYPVLPYTVGYIRSQGLVCKWSRRSNGAPVIVALTDSSDSSGRRIWSAIDGDMWRRASEVGLRQAFDEYTTLIGLFSVRI